MAKAKTFSPKRKWRPYPVWSVYLTCEDYQAERYFTCLSFLFVLYNENQLVQRSPSWNVSLFPWSNDLVIRSKRKWPVVALELASGIPPLRPFLGSHVSFRYGGIWNTQRKHFSSTERRPSFFVLWAVSGTLNRLPYNSIGYISDRFFFLLTLSLTRKTEEQPSQQNVKFPEGLFFF